MLADLTVDGLGDGRLGAAAAGKQMEAGKQMGAAHRAAAREELNMLLILLPLCFALFYPAIGSVLAYVSAVSGFLIIYLLPVLAHMKQMRE